MSVVYHRPEATVNTDETAVEISFGLVNRSPDVWRNEDGFRIGSQILDAETHLYIEDGPRILLDQELASGWMAPVRLRIAPPRFNGCYRIIVCPIKEESFWYYEHGWPFLIVEVTVDNGVVAVKDCRVLTARGLRRQMFFRSATRAFTYPFLTFWRNRGLIRSMTRRDVLSRYRGSFGGVFWTLLNPLLLMLTYFLVFGIVLGTRFEGDSSRWGFVLYFLAGMLPWLPFSEAVGRSPFVMLEHRNFVKKLVFPLEILPVVLVVAGLITQLFALVVFLALLAGTRGGAPPTIAWLFALLVPQAMFTLGICWFLAALGVYFRDLGQINSFLLTLWFFLTPICYPETSLARLPAVVLHVLSKNPLFVLVRGYRAILLDHEPPAFSSLWKLWVLALVVFLAGHAWFYKLRRTFADVI